MSLENISVDIGTNLRFMKKTDKFSLEWKFCSLYLNNSSNRLTFQNNEVPRTILTHCKHLSVYFKRKVITLEILFFSFAVFKYLSAPVYVFVAQWDSYQLQQLVHSQFPTMRLPPELPSEAEYLGKFGKNTHRSLRRVSYRQAFFYVIHCSYITYIIWYTEICLTYYISLGYIALKLASYMWWLSKLQNYNKNYFRSSLVYLSTCNLTHTPAPM